MPMSNRQRGVTAAAAALAVAAIMPFEGFYDHVYRDPVGIPTYCFGETENVEWARTQKFSKEKCAALLDRKIRLKYAEGAEACLKVPLADPTKAAFYSFTYNVGISAFCGSSVARKANAGDIRGACDALLAWDKATYLGRKITLPGLTKRRQAERAMCLEGAR